MEFSSKDQMGILVFSGKIILGTWLLLMILTTTYLIWSEGRLLPGVRVGGIELGGLKVEDATELLSEEVKLLTEQKVILVYKKRPLNLVFNSVGIKLDISESITKAYRIGRVGSFWRQVASRWTIYRHGYNMRPVFNNKRVLTNSFFHLLEAGIAVEPIRSVVGINRKGQISYSHSRAGIVIDQETLTRKLENAAFQKGELTIEVPIKKLVPPLTENDIKKWGLDQVLGMFTTKYEASNKERVNNLLIASGAINNVIIYPGQNFSFNTWVGPRVTEVGYKEAPTLYFGKLVSGVGGGVCQVSSTLYNAALMANLKIVQRMNHSLPSAYVPLARDATVVNDGVDLIIENASNHPILLVSNAEPPFLTVAVLGRKTGWKTVMLDTKIVTTFPFKTKSIPDSSLTKGTRRKMLVGRKGVKAELWRTVELLDGTIKKELVNTSIYPAQPEEYKIGVKPD